MTSHRVYTLGGTFDAHLYNFSEDFGALDWIEKHARFISKFPHQEDPIFRVYKIFKNKEIPFEYLIELAHWGDGYQCVVFEDALSLFEFLNRFSPLIQTESQRAIQADQEERERQKNMRKHLSNML